MLTDKEAKKKYVNKFYEDPGRYYATEYLKQEGFTRKKCNNCRKPFWSTVDRDVCGDPACGESPFTFIANTPAKKPLDYIEVWEKFSKMFKKFGYTPIKRYPIVARWNPTMEYTNASIAAFQPYVISGEIEPPARKLVIPQFCFRTVDIDNVGITGSHNTVFSMIGQHMFVPPEEWDQNEAFGHIHAWLKKGLGLPNDEITFHEDAWAGGGNLGPCMEFFSRGNELGNQVYMMYEQTDQGIKDLQLKVLDMGMGQERNAWFSQGTNTQYDATFPTAMKYLLKKTGVKFDEKLIRKYVPHSGLLNLDEVDDIEKAWKTVAEKTGTDVADLKKNILPLASLYSIAEHSRALLIMFSDGAIPSNVGDSYNLRIIFRRMSGFLDGRDIDVYKLLEIHAKYLEPQLPELAENLENVRKIYDIEKEKYAKSRESVKRIVSRTVSILGRAKSDGSAINKEKLIELYDSHGIPPELIAKEAKKINIGVKVPENFYSLVTERHGKQEQKHATKKRMETDFGDVPGTEALYFDDYRKDSNTATVLKIRENCVILDRTVAYPTSGGQLHDTGKIDGEEFTEVFKQGNLIVHKMEEPPKFREGQKVRVKIDLERRLQLATHHTATHIINEAARRVLGSHANQASAFKDIDKAHIDLTHYAPISEDELERIEKEANNIVKKSIKVKKNFVRRGEAEGRYGFGIYQGGAVPGKELRIVNIIGTDVEACGGTHLDSTSEAEKIIIISTERIQDNIARITFVAGPAAHEYEKKQEEIIKRVKEITGDDMVTGAEKLVSRWKGLKKTAEKTKEEKADKITENLEEKFISNVLVEKINNADMKTLQNVSKTLSADNRTIVLFGVSDKICVFASAGKNSGRDAGKIVRETCSKLGGRGGGSPLIGQGIGVDKRSLDSVVAELRKNLCV